MSLLSKRNRRTREGRKAECRLSNCAVAFEKLEDRALNTVSSVLSPTGVLDIRSDKAADRVSVAESGSLVQVSVAGAGTQAFAGVVQIQFHGGGGDDVFTSRVNRPTVAYGDQGNDTIVSGDAADLIYGGAGNDTLRGGGGTDWIEGDDGNDSLYGGDGDDSLGGGKGDDFLDGGAGADQFYGGEGWDRFFDTNFEFYQPVINGYEAADINQEESPTCQTLGTLAAVAAQGVNFNSRIKRVGTYDYDVTLLGGAGKERVHFDGHWNDNDPMPRQQGNAMEFWTILMQRARLQSLNVKWDVKKTLNDWNKDNDRTGGKLMDAGNAMQAFVGKTTYAPIVDASAEEMQKALKRGDVIVAGTVGTTKKTDIGAGLVGDHVYAVLKVYKNSAGSWMVQLYNPWGHDGNSLDGKDDGFLTVSWKDFHKSSHFEGYWRASA